MNRRRLIATAAAAGLLAGCTVSEEGIDEPEKEQKQEQAAEDKGDEEKEEKEPEPEGGDGTPYTHYDLEIRDKRENGHPV